LPPDHFLSGFLAGLRKAAATYSNWLQQALAEPTKPHTEDHPICSSQSPERFDNLDTQYIGMIANSDKDMANIPKDWEHVEDDDPILDFDPDEYDQFLLDNPDLEELPEGEGTKSKEQPECYMNLQDPEPPREALEKLALESATPPSGDITISDAPYETNDEACLCLLRQIDDLEAENNHLRQQLSQSPDTQQIQVEHTHPTGSQNLANRPYGLLQSDSRAEPTTHPTTQKSRFNQDTPQVSHGPAPRDRQQRIPGTRG
jgi:hypothetical protein